TYIKGKGYYERTLILALTSGIIERVESNTGLSESAENAYKRMMNRSQSDRNYPLQIQKKDGHFIVQLKPGLSPTEYISDGARLSEGSGEAAESMNEWQARLKFYKGRLYEGLYQAFSGTTSGGFGMYVNSAGDMHTAFHVANVDTLILTDQIGLNLAPGNVSLASQQSLLREYSQRPALSEFAVSASERSGLSLRDHLDISLQILGVSPDAIQTLSRIGESNFYKFSFDWRHPDDTHSRRRTVYIAASQPLESLTYTEFPPELTDAIAANNGLDVFIEKAPYFYNEISRDVTRKTLEEGLGDSRGEKEILASNRLKSGLLKAGGLIFSDKEEYGADDAAFPTSGEWLVSETDDFEIIDTPESVNQLSASSEVAEDNGKWGNGRVQILHRIKGKPVSFIDRQGDSGSRLSYDTRPEESGMALPGYIRHDEAVRAAVNPDGAPLKIIYGGSGIDVVHFLKTFDASEGIFVSDFHGLTAADLKDVITLTGFGMQKLKASGDSAIQQYADYKNINGYANRHHVNELYKIKQALAFELLAAGATDIRVVEGRFPTIQFKWSYRPDEPLKIRTIQFAEADITVPAEYPQALKDVIESGFDGFYLRAGMEIASRYGQKKNPLVEYLYNYINQDGVFVTDDVGIIFDTSGGYTRPGAAEYYYDAFPIPVDDIDYVPVPNLIHLAEALLAETPATQALPADFYGWFVRIRRIKSLPEERQIFAAGNIPVKAARLGLVPQLPVLNAGLIQQFFDYGYWIEFESGDKGHTDAYIRHIEGKFDDPDFRDGERHAYLRNNHTYGEIEFIESPYSDSGEPGVELDNIYPRMPRNGLKLGQAAIETAIAFYLEQTDLPERKIHVPLTETRMVNALLEIRSLRAEQREYFGSGEYGIKGEMLPVPQEELEHWKQLNDRNRNMNISEFHRRSESGDMKRFSGARLTDALIYSALHDSARNYTDREWHQIPVGESDYSVRSTGRAKVEIRLNGILQAVNTDVNRVNPTQTSNAFWLSQRQLSTLRSLQSLNTSSKLNPVVLVLDSSPVSDLDPDDVRVDLYYESFARFAFLSGADVRLSQTEADRNSRYLQTAESVFERVRLELISEGREFRGRYLTADMGNPEKAVEAIVRASGISAKKEPGTIHLSIARLSADQPDLIVDFLSGAALIIAAAEHVRFDDDAAETGRIQRESIPAVIVSALADSLGLKGSDRTQKAFWMLEADSRADQIFFGAFPVD
ncbi:MAG: hypothetical protein KC649_02750, partial [Candidatus Omnitrophica bacterium]|nr:hypothetical protein [Candidatus Omnitrophota bacterium]